MENCGAIFWFEINSTFIGMLKNLRLLQWHFGRFYLVKFEIFMLNAWIEELHTWIEELHTIGMISNLTWKCYVQDKNRIIYCSLCHFFTYAFHVIICGLHTSIIMSDGFIFDWNRFKNVKSFENAPDFKFKSLFEYIFSSKIPLRALDLIGWWCLPLKHSQVFILVEKQNDLFGKTKADKRKTKSFFLNNRHWLAKGKKV